MRAYISDTNPNDGIGGGGCVCSPLKCEDCVGPYAIFPATETDSNLSPHVVLSLRCAGEFARKAEDTNEILRSGPQDVVAPVEPTL